MKGPPASAVPLPGVTRLHGVACPWLSSSHIQYKMQAPSYAELGLRFCGSKPCSVGCGWTFGCVLVFVLAVGGLSDATTESDVRQRFVKLPGVEVMDVELVRTAEGGACL
jgi:hypothetical protein